MSYLIRILQITTYVEQDTRQQSGWPKGSEMELASKVKEKFKRFYRYIV